MNAPKPHHQVFPAAPGLRGVVSEAQSPLAATADVDAEQDVEFLTVHRFGEVTVVEVSGGGQETIGAAHRAVEVWLAEPCRAVVVDLSPLAHGQASDWLSGLADLGRLARDWPGTPIAVVCPHAGLSVSLEQAPAGKNLLVTASLQEALTILTGRPEPVTAAVSLAPHPTAPRAARTFVSRSLLDWGLSRSIAATCLITSELVTNAMLHAQTDFQVTLGSADGRVRVAVRDGSSDRPLAQYPQPDRVDGRGLLIVDSLASSWGVLPTRDGGKVVWAVTDQ